MTLKVISVYDSAAKAYSPPIFVQSTGIAIRSMMDMLADANTQFAKHPNDYSIFHLGDFDSHNAQFEIFASPQLLANVWEIKP